METILKAHIDLTERAYSIILEENGILKETGKAPEESLLQRKRDLLDQLDQSVYHLRNVTASRLSLSGPEKAAIRKAQQLILKTLLLDRENEQLLLKCTRRPRRPLSPAAPSHKIHRVYRRPHLSRKENP